MTAKKKAAPKPKKGPAQHDKKPAEKKAPGSSAENSDEPKQAWERGETLTKGITAVKTDGTPGE